MNATIADDTLVIVAGRLGRIVRQSRLGNAHGYDVATSPEGHEGSAPHFAEAWMVHAAIVGENVCAKRAGDCYCGFVHVRHPEWLPVAEAARSTS